MKPLISVCGSDGDDAQLTPSILETAEVIGRLIAQRNGVLLCGGRGGIMQAACKGAYQENGLTIGILPQSKDEANNFVEIALPTGMGHRRNALVVNMGDVVIALCGRWGTLNEISFAMIFQKPLILVRGSGGVTNQIIQGKLMQNLQAYDTYHVVDSAQEAVDRAFDLISQE
jgi:uncharacterized protein (TIGR00725 family)